MSSIFCGGVSELVLFTASSQVAGTANIITTQHSAKSLSGMSNPPSCSATNFGQPRGSAQAPAASFDSFLTAEFMIFPHQKQPWRIVVSGATLLENP
jgi:hypothetical protein